MNYGFSCIIVYLKNPYLAKFGFDYTYQKSMSQIQMWPGACVKVSSDLGVDHRIYLGSLYYYHWLITICPIYDKHLLNNV